MPASGNIPKFTMDAAIRDRVRNRLGPKVAMVTGGGAKDDEAPTIGHAIASVLAAAGAQVVVFERDAEAAALSVELISARGDNVTSMIGDVVSQADCRRAARDVAERFGQIDILVNCAAILGAAPLPDSPEDELMRTLSINLGGPVRMSGACIPFMPRGSSITHIASLGALRSFGKVDYSASKGGLISLAMTMSIQLGSAGIRVNAVSPGQVWTPMSKQRLVRLGLDPQAFAEARAERVKTCPLQEEGSGWDIGLACLFLASADARWITGQNLLVDGGQGGLVGYAS